MCLVNPLNFMARMFAQLSLTKVAEPSGYRSEEASMAPLGSTKIEPVWGGEGLRPAYSGARGHDATSQLPTRRARTLVASVASKFLAWLSRGCDALQPKKQPPATRGFLFLSLARLDFPDHPPKLAGLCQSAVGIFTPTSQDLASKSDKCPAHLEVCRGLGSVA
ncbi:hypothetical protein CCM_00682 [Cordyceps militaris CM01]|uniref:Uncharacterized protein n=1 Tax=Cordyceps militaris (strain CM01) TaxID=983644 RepID=G3J5G6_CORMM|nr:uncharacterized protein CCM_00682 [Cordyceps militaris CM01]EGX96027.1 hypothetical protein CCM_00682 [Cordyceps militaris CM01]